MKSGVQLVRAILPTQTLIVWFECNEERSATCVSVSNISLSFSFECNEERSATNTSMRVCECDEGLNAMKSGVQPRFALPCVFSHFAKYV